MKINKTFTQYNHQSYIFLLRKTVNKTNNVQIKIGNAQNGELGGYCSRAKKNRYKNEHEKVSWLVTASTGASHKHYYIKWYD